MTESNYLFINLETSGLPTMRPGYHENPADEYYPYTDHPKYDGSRIIQLTWYLGDSHEHADMGPVLDKVNMYYIKRNGFTITNTQYHGITNDISDTEGTRLVTVIKKKGFRDALRKADYLVAHNAPFVINILLNELERLGSCKGTIKRIQKMAQKGNIFDTCQLGKPVCQLKWRGPGYKPPKLAQLFKQYHAEQVEIVYNGDQKVDRLLSIYCLIDVFGRLIH